MGDGNYINVGTSGRNIGVFTGGAMFLTFNLNYDTSVNSYKYNGNNTASAIELSANSINLNYAASGTAGNTITLTTGFSVTTGGNASFFGAGSFGSGTNVIFVTNRGAAPSSNPTGGFILYGESGAAKIRGSGGTTTTIANANPHCPTCKTDYVHEWENDNYGYLAVCMNCYANDNKSFTRKKGAWNVHA
jgi:hypothetical protein